jgi:hypothetical protein
MVEVPSQSKISPLIQRGAADRDLPAISGEILLWLGTFALAGCAPNFKPAARLLGQALPAPREVVFERQRSWFDSRATQLSRERGVLILEDNSLVSHGRDSAWYSNGFQHFEREFERGEPRGRWRSWFENGVLESEATYEPDELTTMTWWREDGQLSSSGTHIGGAREGEWTYYHDNGLLAARGEWSRGERHGAWVYFDALGQFVECGRFERGQRSGAWERRIQ